MSNSLYDKLKFTAVILLPALGMLYFAAAGIWDLPATEQIIGIIITVDTCLGGLLYIFERENQAQGGVLKIQDVGDKKLFSLELATDPVIFEDKKEVVFRVDVDKGEDE